MEGLPPQPTRMSSLFSVIRARVCAAESSCLNSSLSQIAPTCSKLGALALPRCPEGNLYSAGAHGVIRGPSTRSSNSTGSGPLAEWIRRRPSEPEIPGSSPGRISYACIYCAPVHPWAHARMEGLPPQPTRRISLFSVIRARVCAAESACLNSSLPPPAPTCSKLGAMSLASLF